MGKTLLLLATVGLMTAVQIGCRACGSPYDYSSPLATCGCEASCGCETATGCTSCGTDSEAYYEGEVVVTE